MLRWPSSAQASFTLFSTWMKTQLSKKKQKTLHYPSIHWVVSQLTHHELANICSKTAFVHLVISYLYKQYFCHYCMFFLVPAFTNIFKQIQKYVHLKCEKSICTFSCLPKSWALTWLFLDDRNYILYDRALWLLLHIVTATTVLVNLFLKLFHHGT